MAQRADRAGPPRLIALDFDGVVSDSAPESFAVALLTYAELYPDTCFAGPLRHFSSARAPAPAEVAADPLYARFVELMPLGNRAEDFGVALRSVELGEPVADQAGYDRFRASVDPEWIDAFHARFYEIRTALSRNDARGWRALMGPYPEFIALLRRRHRDAELAIATSKDRRSVAILLAEYGIADLFGDDRVLDKETGVRKDSHLRALHERTGVPYAETLFIDDKLNHLEVVAALGVRCGLARWGYNSEREAAQARARGFPVFELATAERQIFG